VTDRELCDHIRALGHQIGARSPAAASVLLALAGAIAAEELDSLGATVHVWVNAYGKPKAQADLRRMEAAAEKIEAQVAAILKELAEGE
jgi:chorismate synthase